MGQATQTIGQTDFSGGVNAVTSPYLITKKQVARCRNMILDEHGALSTRPGYSVVATSPDTINPIVYYDVLNKVSGATYPFAIQRGTNDVLYDASVTPWRVVGSFNDYATPQAVTMTDTLVIAAGYQTPLTWTGTTLGTITATSGQTAPAGANHLAFHLGSLWVWNTNDSTTTYDGPSSLRMSDPNNFNSWPNANQTFVAKDDGQQGMGLATFTIVETGISPTATLVLFKNFSAYQFTGLLGSTTSSLQRIKSDMGCVAPRTIQFVSGYGVLRLSHKGFALFNGVDDKLVSEEIRPYIFGHDDILGLNFGAISQSWAAQSQNPPLYVCACPVGGTALNRVFVYDLIRRAWTICDFPETFQTLTLFETQTSQPVLRAGTTSRGRVLAIFNSDESDNGVPIDWSVRTRAFFSRSFMQPTYWRRAILDLEISTPQSLTVNTTLRGIAETRTQTNTLLPIAGRGATYGSGIYGTSVYSVGSLTDARTCVDVMRTSPSLYMDISGTGNVRLRGLELHAVPKKPTRVHA